MSLNKFLKKRGRQSSYSVSDITIVLCVRISDKNPWIIDRLSLISTWYTTRPEILIIDYGSEGEFLQALKECCKTNNYRHVYMSKNGVFSLSESRNQGFIEANTELLFFTDPDFVFERDIFDRLLKVANATNIGFNSFSRITMPAYHISEQATELFEAGLDNTTKENQLIEWGYHGVYSEYNGVFEYISPYSNNFFCHRNYYDLLGGYSTDFVGHGSEDFELIIRANLLQGHMPLPDKLGDDVYKPGLPSSVQEKYEGFRRLAEVEAFSGELQGFKSFHLWHPRVASKGWYENNDMKRKKFNSVVSRYLKNKLSLLSEDYLPRKQHALCIISDESHFGFFLPLRALGYSFDVLSESAQIKSIIKNIEQNKYTQAFIYNPYTEKTFRNVVDTVLSLPDINVTVIERGALPNSLYYADDMSYNDKDFNDLTLSKLQSFSEQQTSFIYKDEQIDVLIGDLRKGAITLERNADYQKSVDNLEPFLSLALSGCAESFDLKIFIPLQLPYDAAVTLFNEEYPEYEDFLTSILTAIDQFPEVKFIVKPHPLLKEEYFPDVLTKKANNLYLSKNDENIHALIELSDAVIVYNSGVGLLSLLHNKPVFHMGNVYYSVGQHFATKIENIASGVEQLNKNKAPSFNEQEIRLFMSWLVSYKYSFFDAIDEYRELEFRNSHAYQNIQVSVFNYKGQSYTFGSLDSEYSYSSNSYAAARLGLNTDDDHRNYVQNLNKNLSLFQSSSVRLFSIFVSPFLSSHNKTMLLENPKLFFRTAKHPFSVWVGRNLGLR